MDHEIVRSVAAAQKDAQAADALVRQCLPFIKAETAKFLKRIPIEGQDDELGIAMFAFHEPSEESIIPSRPNEDTDEDDLDDDPDDDGTQDSDGDEDPEQPDDSADDNDSDDGNENEDD